MNKSNKLSVLGLIFVSAMITDMDRTNIPVAPSAISSDLSLTPVQMGIVSSAFAWSLATIVQGWVIRLSVTRLKNSNEISSD